MATIIDRNKAARTKLRPTPYAPPATHIVVMPHPRKAPGGLRPVPTVAPLPMGQRGNKAARTAKNLSVRSPMIAAVLFASFAVSLLCLYVTAYARVNAEGLQLSRLRQDLKAAQKQEITLNGEISRFHLSAPGRAQAMGLMPAPPEAVEVLTPPAPDATK